MLPKNVRYAFRLFLKNPAFAGIAVLTLAVGIGANTSIFSVTNALLLRPLPFSHPDRLVLISSLYKGDTRPGPLTLPRFELVRDRNRSLESVSAFTNETFNLTGRGDPEQVQAARVSWNFFDVLGVRPVLGRSFAASDGQPQSAPVALISQRLWSRRYASSPSAIGEAMTLDSRDYVVAGVLPADFRFDLIGVDADVFVPRPFELNLVTDQQIRAGVGYLLLVGRLRNGISIPTAQAEINTLSADYSRENAKMPDAQIAEHVGNLRDEMVSGARTAVLILFGAVALVLLIACANVASLLLSRALGRRREVAVRTAIGAARSEIIGQLLTESVILALLGGVLGVLLSSWGTRLLTAIAPDNLPRATEIHADGYVLAFALGISLLSGILFGLAPALQASRTDLNSALRAEGRGSTSGKRRNGGRNLLVVSQVALSTVLLVGAGLLIRNFVQLRTQRAGFDGRGLLTMKISLPPARYPGGPKMTAFYDELLSEVRALPGVRTAAVSSALPVNPSRTSPMLPEGQPQVPFAQMPMFIVQMVSPGYAAAMRIPLLRGREFTPHDDANAPLVIMVNEATARRFWPNQNPIGKHIYLRTTPVEIVGVLGDVKNVSLSADVQPEVIFPFAQRPWLNMHLLVSSSGDPRSLIGAVRARVAAIDREQPVTDVETMDEVLEKGAAQPRFTTSLLGSLSGVALLLAIIGIYGVMAYSVTERTPEMGIRMALGASRGDILRLVLRQGVKLAACGIVIGIAASLALTRLLSSMLYHVSQTDALTFISAAVLFTGVALAASYIPARRATRVDPVIALRGD